MTQTTLLALIEKAQRGDEAAFTALYDESVNMVYYTALKILHDTQLAEDVVQEVFVEVHQRLDTLREPLAFFQWVKRIAAFKCSHMRRKRREVLYSGAEDGVYLPNPADKTTEGPQLSAERREQCEAVARMIDRLPQAQREAVVMFYYQQLKVGEIAKILQVNENTVKSRLAYAREKIGRQLAAFYKGEAPVG